MTKADRLYKLSQGSDTAIWACDEILRQDDRIAELELSLSQASKIRNQDCKTMSEMTLDNIRLSNRIAELEKEHTTLLSCLLGISNECIGEIAMNYKLDAQMIGESIYVATGKTNPELAEALKEQGE